MKLFKNLKKVINIWDELKANDDALKPIVNKWNKRDKDVTLFCFSVITLFCEHIEETYQFTNDLSKFDDKRTTLKRRIINYLEKYKSKIFRLFPHALDKKNKLNNKEEWAQELNELLCLQMNSVINEKGNAR